MPGKVFQLILATVTAAAVAAVGPASAASAATAKPATANTRVEVCGEGPAAQRPDSMILTCADNGELVRNLRWTSWTGASATATGDVAWRACASQCAAETHWDQTAAQVSLLDPTVEPNGEVLFTRLALHTTGPTPHGFMRDLTFDESPATPASSPAAAPALATHATVTPQSAAAPAASGPSGTLSYADIEGYWIAAGGPSSTAETAAAITGAESSFLPGIIQQDVDYCGSGADRAGWGLWQITCGNSVPAYGSDFQLLDPWNNAEAAVSKYNADVAAGYNGFDPWSTYTSGAYTTYLESVAANTGVTDPGEYVQDGSTPSGTPSSPAADPGSTYGPPLSSPSGPGSFHVFSVSPTGNLYQDTYSSGWTGWQNLDNDGENLTGAPGVVYDPDDGTYHVFAIGATSGNVYQVTYTPGSGWGNWQNLGGVLQGGLSAAYVDGTFHVFSVSPSGNLYQDTYSSGWTGWQNLDNDGENLTGAPGVVYDPDDGTYHVFAIGATSGNVYQVTYTPGSGWGNWQNLGGVLQGGVSAAYVDGTFHVFSVSPSGNLYQDTYSSGWTGWQNIGDDSENLTGAPGIAYDTYDGTYHAFAQGATSGNMYQVTYGPGGWGSWQNLGGALDDGFNAVYVPST